MRIIGREKEQEKLKEALEKEESQLIAVYGRRRVGKTYLIENTLAKEIIFDITGIKGASIRTQLSNFKAQIVKRSKKFQYTAQNVISQLGILSFNNGRIADSLKRFLTVLEEYE